MGLIRRTRPVRLDPPVYAARARAEARSQTGDAEREAARLVQRAERAATERGKAAIAAARKRLADEARNKWVSE